MARVHHLIISTSSALSVSQVIGLVAMAVMLCALAVFKCTSYYSQRRWRKATSSCYGCGFSDRDIIVRYNGEPRFLKSQVEEDHADQGDADISTLWQRNILMGGKCQMPDFSGVIIYDVTGNVVPPRKGSRT